MTKLPAGKPSVVIGQIHGHGKGSEIVKLLAVVKDSTAPDFVVQARVKEDAGEGEIKEIALDLGTYQVGEMIDYRVVMEEGTLRVYIREEKCHHKYHFGRYAEWEAAGGHDKHQYYFKLGNYCNCNAETADSPDETAEVVFAGWDIRHGHRCGCFKC